MKKYSLDVSTLVTLLNKHTDPMDEWGQWFVAMHIQYVLEGETTDVKGLVSSILCDRVVEEVLDVVIKECEAISYYIGLYRDDIIDFEVTDSIVWLIRNNK